MSKIQRGFTSYKNIKIVHDKEACYNLGLLADNKEYIDAIIEASNIAFRNQLRRLFITLLFMNTMSKPNVVWKSTWKLMVDEIVYERRRTLNVTVLNVVEPAIQWHNKLSYLFSSLQMEKLLNANGKSLKDFSCLPFPNFLEMSLFQNKFIVDELNYDIIKLIELLNALLNRLTKEQLGVYEKNHEIRGFFFLCGYGRTGKTFLWKILLAALRSQGSIVLNVTSISINHSVERIDFWHEFQTNFASS
ncbi:hypothetical protein GmHk_12G034319 [Glycine max]|nr:hypothetical protein GmHk_12G034319 [Glycine max]